METHRRDVLDILLLIGSILAIGFSILTAGSLAILAGLNSFIDFLANVQAAWTVALIFGTMGLLTLPGLILSYRSISGKASPVSSHIPVSFLAVACLFPLALALGVLSSQFNLLPSLLQPIAHVVAAVTPMIFMSIYVFRQLPHIPWRRFWGQFSAGLWLSPLVALFLEMLTAIPLLILLFGYLWTELDTRELLEPLTTNPQLAEGYLEAQLEAALNQPALIITAIVYVTVLVPLLEEVVKTIAVWPLLRRGIQPVYGFVGGVIAGGAYGIFEAFFLAQPGDDWLPLMVARAGATCMHMFTTGMAGLGLAVARSEKNWKLALRYYLLAVLLHGLWNLAALGLGLGMIAQETEFSTLGDSLLEAIVIVGGSVLVLLTATAVGGLHSTPRQLLGAKRRSMLQESPPDSP